MKFKKFLAICMVFAVMLSCCVLSAFGATTSLTSNGLKNGVATYTLAISDSNGIGVFDCVIVNEGATDISVAASGAKDCEFNPVNGRLIVNMPAGQTTNTLIIKITAKTDGSGERWLPKS